MVISAKERALLKELKLRNDRLRYQRDPLAWLEERFGEDRNSYEWTKFKEYKDHKWDGDVDPLARVWMDIASVGRTWGCVSAATGTGKTRFLSRVVFWFLDCFPNSLVVTSAPKESQLKLQLWREVGAAFEKFKKIRPEAVLTSLKLSLSKGTNSSLEAGYEAVGFVAGVGAGEEACTRAQGFHRADMLIICEETTGMDEAIMLAFINTCVGEGNNKILSVGNPNHDMDQLAIFSRKDRVNHYRISSYDHPNVVCKKSVHSWRGRQGIYRRASARAR